MRTRNAHDKWTMSNRLALILTIFVAITLPVLATASTVTLINSTKASSQREATRQNAIHNCAALLGFIRANIRVRDKTVSVTTGKERQVNALAATRYRRQEQRAVPRVVDPASYTPRQACERQFVF